MTELFGVTLPVALVKKMKILKTLKLDTGDEFTIEHIPEDLRKYVDSALRELSNDSSKKVSSIRVYEFLGISHVRHRFIHGDKLLKITDINMITSGYTRTSSSCKTIDIDYYYTIFDDMSLITPHILRECQYYTRLMYMYKDHNGEPRRMIEAETLAMQQYLADYGYIPEKNIKEDT